jgi:endonuclease YncB( thermonuclease family)
MPKINVPFLVILLLYGFFMSSEGLASVRDELRQVFSMTKPKAVITNVISGDTLVINNTETVHLPAIYIPMEMGGVVSEAMSQAKTYLDENWKGETVSIFQMRGNSRGTTNALGHIEGYILREDNVFLQEDMLQKGLAFAYPSQSHNVVAAKLYEAEDRAREAGLGLWADKNFQILNAHNIFDNQGLDDKDDGFAIVEGVVERVAARNNVIYLNFDKDWKKDFTIAVNSGLRRDFSKAGYNLMQMDGQAVRVRGWMREYNGPYIEIFDPSQLQLLDELTIANEDEIINKNSAIEDSIKDRVLPNSPMFPNLTIDDVSETEGN